MGESVAAILTLPVVPEVVGEEGDGRLDQGDDGDPHVVRVVINTLALPVSLHTLRHGSHGLEIFSIVFQ